MKLLINEIALVLHELNIRAAQRVEAVHLWTYMMYIDRTGVTAFLRSCSTNRQKLPS